MYTKDECKRYIKIGKYTISHKSTVRKTAEHFGISKTTVHIILRRRLPEIDDNLYSEVSKILEINKAERHLRGGAATKKKYKKLKNKYNNMFSTGLLELDTILNGGLHKGNEVLAIYADTNNGKTLVAEKIAISIWEQGYNVGVFSPEICAEDIKHRFDILSCKKYKHNLSSKRLPVFNVITRNEFLSQFHNNITVTNIKNWIVTNDLKTIVIDGMQYLKNERGGHNKTIVQNLTEIFEDLMFLSQDLHIPIITALQTNYLKTASSYYILNSEFNISRAISVCKEEDTIKLYLSKNIYGEKEQYLYYHYDVNTGVFTYISNSKN